MKNNKFINILLIFLIVFLINPIISFAEDSTDVYLDSDKRIVKKGEEVEVSFNIEDEKTAAYLVNIYFDDTKFEFISGPENIAVEDGLVKILWYDEQGGSGAESGELGSIKLRAKEYGISDLIINGEFYDENCELIETNFESLKLEVGEENLLVEEVLDEENTNLETLAIENVLLYPPFDNLVTKYNIEISNDTTKLNILAVPENKNGKVEIIGNENLVEGNNEIIVAVTAANGVTTKNYYINAYKRNLEEEEEYQKEQEELKEKLEQAYEIEKASAIDESTISLDTESVSEIEERNNFYVFKIIGFIIFIAIMVGIAGRNYKK